MELSSRSSSQMSKRSTESLRESRKCRLDQSNRGRHQPYLELPMEWWERTEDCTEAKYQHMDKIDRLCDNREKLVLLTTLYKRDTVMEPNMFPCK